MHRLLGTVSARVLTVMVLAAMLVSLLAWPGTASAVQLGQRSLSRGDRGDDVRTLQRALNEAGVSVGWIDGVYGPATQKAVRAFQKARGLRADGEADALTIRELLVDQPKTTPLTAPAPAGAQTHIVQAGDTLSKLAAQYGTTVRAIMDVNGLLSTTIYVGQALKLPGLTKSSWTEALYTVKPGDALSVIAVRYETTVAELKRLNGLSSDKILVGQKLKLPGGETPRTEDSGSVYTVKKGDSLSVVAERFDVTVQQLRRENGLKSTTIIIGQKLRIPGVVSSNSTQAPAPGPITHTVKPGESLWSIAAKYGTSISELRRANELSRSVIYKGEVLTIPGTGSTPVTPVEAQPEDKRALGGRVIVIDPGHGGKGTAGTYGITSGVHESVITMDIARRLEKALSEAGATVVLTREEDGSRVGAGGGTVDLQGRVDIAQAAGADVFVSIHNNWSDDPGPNGVITFFYYGKSDGERLGRAIHPELVRSTGMKDGDVRSSGYFVVHHTTMPAVLVEIGFMSNTADEAQLLDASFRQRAADGLYNGLVRYLSQNP